MYEVEVKIPADIASVRGRLQALDADAQGTVEQSDTYFDHPARSFAETDEALRIRRTDARIAVTYKGPKVDEGSKTRREFETDVGDADVAEAILGALDFEPVAEVHKTRECYELDGYVVTLDAVDGLGEFVEVEAEGLETDIDELRDGAEAVLERLGLDAADQVRKSYLELLLNTS